MRLNKLTLMLIGVAVVLLVVQTSHTQAGYEAKKVADGLSVPWSMAWLPDGDMLVTERRGDILRVRDGKVIAKLSGVPEVKAKGQGGLLDLVLHPGYASNQLIYLSYADATGTGGSNTAIARARLEGNALVNFEVIYKALPNTTGGNHFGSRIAFDEKSFLFFSVGDRGDRNTNPQDLKRDGGKVYRLHDDGKVPVNNPFIEESEQGVLAGIYSLGHRNIQGMAVHPESGEVWTHEHGPRGGDEVNVIKPGANYGWPILSYGVNYSGTSFAEGTERKGYESPGWYWDPSIAPSGMAFVTSEKYPEWRGHLLVGSLKFGQLVLCELDGDDILSATPVMENIGRVRDVRQGPDGFIYVAIDGVGILRIEPVS